MDVTKTRLLSAIKDPNNRLAWATFYETYHGFIRSIARRYSASLSKEDIEDVVQQVFTQICQGKVSYTRGKGSFRALLATVTRYRCLDRLGKKARVREQRLPTKEAAEGANQFDTEQAPANKQVADEEWRSLVIERTKKAVLLRVQPKNYQIYDACVVRGRDVQEVMETLGVTRNQVYLAKSRIGKIFAEEARKVAELLDNPDLPPLGADGPVDRKGGMC